MSVVLVDVDVELLRGVVLVVLVDVEVEPSEGIVVVVVVVVLVEVDVDPLLGTVVVVVVLVDVDVDPPPCVLVVVVDTGAHDKIDTATVGNGLTTWSCMFRAIPTSLTNCEEVGDVFGLS